jgi:hypothetical protein
VFARRLPAPPAILYLRQGPFPADLPGKMLLPLLDNPAQVAGFFVVLSDNGMRRRPLP